MQGLSYSHFTQLKNALSLLRFGGTFHFHNGGMLIRSETGGYRLCQDGKWFEFANAEALQYHFQHFQREGHSQKQKRI